MQTEMVLNEAIQRAEIAEERAIDKDQELIKVTENNT
jgi:hypothetical protein